MAGELIEAIGIEDVQRMLRDGPKTLVATGFVRALSAGGNVIAGVLEAKTPVKEEDVGGLLDKGELRESVMVAVTLDPQFRGGSAEIGFGKIGFVAYWLEYGHRILPHNPATRNSKEYLNTVKGFVKANPFMRDAADASADAAIEAFAASLIETMSEIFPSQTT